MAYANEVPGNVKSPVSNYYIKIKWDKGFEKWNLVRFSTPMDGSCLFHAITNAFFEPYHTEILNGKFCSRKDMVRLFRKELSEILNCKITPSDPNSKTYYDTLNNGYTSVFAEAVPEFKLEYMQRELNSDASIGYGYIEFIGNAINKDIYILEASRRDMYILDNPALIVKGDRNSIVLYYISGHYELVGIQNNDGTFDTHFSPNHSFIEFLKYKIFTNLDQQA